MQGCHAYTTGAVSPPSGQSVIGDGGAGGHLMLNAMRPQESTARGVRDVGVISTNLSELFHQLILKLDKS